MKSRLSYAAATALALGIAAFAAPMTFEDVDPHTGGKPELMQAAGVVSYGGFEFAREDTAAIERLLGVVDIKWIETAHFEIGFGLGPYKLRQDERKKVAAELTRLKEKLPSINPKQTQLDPWLRAHLVAQRLEDSYAQFLSVVRLTDADFPDGTTPFVPGEGKAYMGEGPILGQKGKIEVLLLPSEAASVTFLRHSYGMSIKRTQRWNLPDRDTLSITIHEAQGRLRVDTALHAHLVFNAAHCFLEGLKHYSYDAPRWLQEGFAHWMERQVSPLYNSFDGDEGSAPEMTSKSDWEAETKKMVASGDAPRISEMINFTTYGEFEIEHHFATWSMIDFLAREHPDGLANLLKGIKGLLDEKGYADGSRVPDTHRELFRSEFGMTYLQFDEAWRTWVLATY